MLGPLATASRRTPWFYIAIHQVSLLSHAATVARRLCIDVHDNDNAWQRGPLWPHRMGPALGWVPGSPEKTFGDNSVRFPARCASCHTSTSVKTPKITAACWHFTYLQEKWRIRQEETRLRVAQSSLEQERLRLTETIQRERLDLEAAKVGVFHLIVRCVEWLSIALY